MNWQERANSRWHSKVKPNRHNNFLVAFDEGQKEEDRRAARGRLRRLLSILWSLARTTGRWPGRISAWLSRGSQPSSKRTKRKSRPPGQERRSPKYSARHGTRIGDVHAPPSPRARDSEIARVENIFARTGGQQ